MALSFDDLQLLLDIVDCGSFSQAAARRRWSQPQVSQRVQLLEDKVGVPLFTRHRRGAIPTAACGAFLPAAREALAALEAGCRAVRSTPALPRVTVACMPSLAPVMFSPILLRLADAPLEIRCATDHSPVIMDNLLTGEADLGFVVKCPAIAGIRLEPVCASPIVALARPDHPCVRAGARSLADIANERLAPQYWHTQCDELIRTIHARRTVRSPIHAIQPSSAAVELALEHGFLTFMPEIAAARQLRNGALVKLELEDLPVWHWEVVMAYRDGKRAQPGKQLVLDVARQLAAEWAEAAA